MSSITKLMVGVAAVASALYVSKNALQNIAIYPRHHHPFLNPNAFGKNFDPVEGEYEDSELTYEVSGHKDLGVQKSILRWRDPAKLNMNTTNIQRTLVIICHANGDKAIGWWAWVSTYWQWLDKLRSKEKPTSETPSSPISTSSSASSNNSPSTPNTRKRKRTLEQTFADSQGSDSVQEECFLLVEYPGYSNNAGKPSRDVIVASLIAAVEAAIKKVERDSGSKISRVSFLGHSLGTSVAAYAAKGLKKKMKDLQLDKLVLLAPFTSLVSVVKELKPPVRYFANLINEEHRYNTLEVLQDLLEEQKTPIEILLIHGKSDNIIDSSHSKQIYDAISKKEMANAKLFLVDDIHHNNIIWQQIPLTIAYYSLSNQGIPLKPDESNVEASLEGPPVSKTRLA